MQSPRSSSAKENTSSTNWRFVESTWSGGTSRFTSMSSGDQYVPDVKQTGDRACGLQDTETSLLDNSDLRQYSLCCCSCMLSVREERRWKIRCRGAGRTSRPLLRSSNCTMQLTNSVFMLLRSRREGWKSITLMSMIVSTVQDRSMQMKYLTLAAFAPFSASRLYRPGVLTSTLLYTFKV
jgi:hypothetical protein